jgi:hypothetical protein
MSGIEAGLYERLLTDFEARAEAFLERGEGSEAALLREAEELLKQREEYPEVFARHGHVEGLVAEMIARRRQAEVFGAGAAAGAREAPGCLLGWLGGLAGRRRGGRGR